MLQTVLKTSPRLYGRLKLAQLLTMPERDFEKRIKEIESSDLFSRLRQAGVVSMAAIPNMRFMTRRLGGWELRSSGASLAEIIEGKGDVVELIQNIGREKFEECFLKTDSMSDGERAARCGISPEDTRKILGFVNRLYIQSEFEGTTAPSEPLPVFSAVAGIDIENGRPILGFFHQEIWKGRYRIDQEKQKQWFSSLPPKEALRAKNLLGRLEFFNQRKNTLYRILESLLEIQREYIMTGNPDKRRPFTQRALAFKLDIETSALNRLISNKAIQMPWGLDIPIKKLLPSSKTILKERLYQIAAAKPGLSDRKLAFELWFQCRVRLSRRSIAQYRKELGLTANAHTTKTPCSKI